MADDKKPTPDLSEPAYEVGYGKPPAHTQFKKGQSGNPRGRPKGTLNVATVLKRELNAKVTVTENGRQKVVTKGEAALKQLVNRSAQGEIAFMRLLLPAMNAAEAALSAEQGKASVDLTDPSLLSSLVSKFNQGGEIVLKAPTANSNAGNASIDESPSTPNPTREDHHE